MWFYLFLFVVLLFIFLSFRPIYPRGDQQHSILTSPTIITTSIATRTNVPNNPDPAHATAAVTPTRELQFVKTGYGLVHVALLAPDQGKTKLTLQEMQQLTNLVVLIHGFSIPMIIWSSVAMALRRAGWYVLLMDNYGRGYSDSPDTTHHGGLYVSQINQVLTALNVTQPIHLAGVSMGGAISALYTSTFPSRVATLTLVCAAGFPPHTPPIARLMDIPIVGDFLFKNLAPKMVLTSDKTWQIKGTPLYHAYCRFLLNFVASHPGYLRSLFRTLHDFPMGSLACTYSALGRDTHRPVLIIWGRLDSLLPYEHGLAMHRSIPNSNLVTIEGSNHNMLIDNPIPIGEAMCSFYDKNKMA